jgi:hypothetical protein
MSNGCGLFQTSYTEHRTIKKNTHTKGKKGNHKQTTEKNNEPNICKLDTDGA